MTAATVGRVQTEDAGVSVLLVYGAELYPPKARADGSISPGIRVTVDGKGTCLLQAVGFDSQPAAQTAIARADQACVLAGLEVKVVGPVDGCPARLVRRRPEARS